MHSVLYWLPLLFLMPASAFPTLHDLPLVRGHQLRPLFRRQSMDTGVCGSTEIRFADGLDGQPQTAYKPVNTKDFNHGASTNIQDILIFICNRLQSPCEAPASTQNTCRSNIDRIRNIAGGQAADEFNNLFGISTNYGGGNGGNNGGNNQATTTTTPRATSTPAEQRSTPPNQDQQSSPVRTANDPGTTEARETNTDGNVATTNTAASSATITAAASSGVVGGGVVGQFDAVQCTLVPILLTVTISAPGAIQTDTSNGSNGDATGLPPMSFGTCTDPTIKVGLGLDNRPPNQIVFINNNVAQFDHSGSLDIKTITEFTCNNLISKCGLTSEDPVYNACEVAEMVANTWGNTGKAADIFNQALGFTTNYASVDGSS